MLLWSAGNFHCLFHSICLCLPVPEFGSLCISGVFGFFFFRNNSFCKLQTYFFMSESLNQVVQKQVTAVMRE